MILSRGELLDSAEQERILAEMESYINCTLSEKTLPTEKVVAAIARLGAEIAAGNYDELLGSLQTDNPQQYKLLAASMLSRENLELKLKTELRGLMPLCTISQ